ncbi:MAG: 5'-nucleotidase C-terminal domain-containing protein [Bacteroidales bacterium]|jgi:2',3'-cyclic-nucleotide 2'-phosphodiesterase (5'-nucleotidase family)|nr:5'-nucleotidase C-terminal domain-containing protein [Bacteroidales bacterium]
MKKTALFILIFGLFVCGQAQKSFTFTYSKIMLDSTYRNQPDNPIVKILKPYKKLHDREMSIIIGEAEENLKSQLPQSPMSNLCTDVLFEAANHYCELHQLPPVDLSLLNFGGIRDSLLQGPITIGKIYVISPFDNYLCIIELKGSTLQQIFSQFTSTRNQPYSHAKINYKEHKPAQIWINGAPLDPNKNYRLATVDFIRNGGDNIIPNSQDIKGENVTTTKLILRELIIDHIKNLTAAGMKLSSQLDDRSVIE